MVSINFLGKKVTLKLVNRTYDNGRIAIEAVTGGESFGILTVNIPNADLAKDEVCVKVWNENAYWVPQVLSSLKDRFVPTGREIRTGFVSAPVYRLVS